MPAIKSNRISLKGSDNLKPSQLFLVGAISVVLASSATAAGWKKGSIERLQTSGYADLNQGQCAAWFRPVNSNIDMSECNGSGGAYYVSFDCVAETAPTTGLTRNSARLTYENAQIAALTSNQISLYVEDVKVNGFCVATQSTIIFNNP